MPKFKSVKTKKKNTICDDCSKLQNIVDYVKEHRKTIRGIATRRVLYEDEDTMLKVYNDIMKIYGEESVE